MGPVMAATRQYANIAAEFAVEMQPLAVPFHFVRPFRPLRRLACEECQTGFDACWHRIERELRLSGVAGFPPLPANGNLQNIQSDGTTFVRLCFCHPWSTSRNP